MRDLKITEPEILEVLLGGADPALEARVRQSLRLRPESGALYVQWAGVVPLLQGAVASLRQMNRRIGEHVMDRLSREDPVSAVLGAAPPPRRRARLLVPLALLLGLALLLLLAILLGAPG